MMNPVTTTREQIQEICRLMGFALLDMAAYVDKNGQQLSHEDAEDLEEAFEGAAMVVSNLQILLMRPDSYYTERQDMIAQSVDEAAAFLRVLQKNNFGCEIEEVERIH